MTANYDALNEQRIQQSIQAYAKDHLNTTFTGKISCFDSIDSTNTWLLEHGKHNDFCLSETQTAGRGRQNNPWISPNSGNIYLSYCCYLNGSIPHRSLLGLVVGIAISEALQSIGLEGQGIKWPNDIFWNNKKLGGILIQTAENYEKFVIGIGLNVSLPNDSREKITQAAVSLEEAMKEKTVNREQVVIQLMQHLLSHAGMFAKLPFHAFLQSWQRWDILHNRTVHFQHQGKNVSGKVQGIDTHGRIGIEINANIEYFSAVDIKLNKPK